ncbi:putative RDD family membrane protein YckC [Streptomyces olivoverticillatus]|uniref:Putative RDD family membrane protein YckC n=1 Tax=Streptomyces olivoverticillatus TaxID=66427 RepID=A0A7W7LMA0_9ACTN|nr:RDD family protein [Streptomyces olivoverticillatus]MBB4892171.1 putative RDD family membrane protein YckC [Streptomyces olivoverticillatus]
MSAPTSGSADNTPQNGYYPDPSIPGYIRYWSGTAWVPGTSRPAPAEGEPMPAPPASVSAPALPVLAAPVPPTPERQARPAAAVQSPEETGPVFLDEEPAPAAEPAAAWQADAGRQEGFGGEKDRRVSWGGQAPAVPAARDPRLPDTPVPAATAGAEAQTAEGAHQGTLNLRPKPHGSAPGGPPAPLPMPPAQAQGRAQSPARASGPDLPAAASPAPQAWPEQRTREVPAEEGAAALPVRREQQQLAPAQVGWAQQVQQLAQQQPGGEGVMPWKPPVDDPFLRAAQAEGRPASLGRRLAARLLDTAVLGAVVVAAAVPLWNKSVEHIDAKIDQAKQSGQTVTVWLLDGTTGAYLAIVLAVLLVGGVLYEALPTAKWGSTLGKKLFGIRVLGIESHDLTPFGSALRRWLVYGVLGVLAVGVFNAMWCLFDRPWRQCWHDKAARTFVASAKG